MKNKISNSLALFVIFILFLAAVLVNNVLFDKAKIDLTEDNIYSISEGTKSLLGELNEPINLYFFFSDKASEGIPQLRNYAARVKALLEEYQRHSDGNISIKIIDPEPFSEAEDRAAEFGLTAANIGGLGDNLYFGLGATNSLDDQEIIGFFDPQQEAFLEYEISKLIHKLSNPEPIKVSIISSLNIEGGQNPMTGGMEPPWAIYQQLDQLYQTEILANDTTVIPKSTNVLMLVHPKQLSEELLYAIDQYVLSGGKVVAYLDPHAESDMANGMGMANSSDMKKLLDAWGIAFDPSKVILDAAKGLEIRMPSGGVGRHLGFIGLHRENIDEEDVVTAGLESINGASFGVLSKLNNATAQFTTLLSSSNYASTFDASLYAMQSRNPEQLLKAFSAQNSEFTLAARIEGTINSAFDAVPEGIDKAGHLTATKNAQIIVVADTDILTDRFWVNTQNFFGSMVLQPFANNGDFATNLIESLGGTSSLISVRGRGRYARPFDVVEQLTIEAEAKFRAKEQELEERLANAERQLNELQAQQADAGMLTLSAEQEAAINQFMEEKLSIRKELREVRHQLDKDIENLGSVLKFLNIAVAPLVLILLLVFIARKALRRQSAHPTESK
ncbi:Gldg family protein [Flocculibacter collagenilyticus]|uniref:Gldg family protein n=1 Tax=Flocculibacter collagenilyticus TaxID=2744479 RepID=UPI0018F4B99C|nr:Gldg family protein [Flocculibacter collagenilyticus]